MARFKNKYELLNRYITQDEVTAGRNNLLRHGAPIDITDATIDQQWARMQSDTQAPRPYFDYFFSSSDIRVYVAEVGDDLEYGQLPMNSLQFNVTQQKAPIYGFWSYTYDEVMRGSRVIEGQFTLITKHPNYMKNLLTKAAQNRSAKAGSLDDGYLSPRAWREDDVNIDKYWGKHLDASAQMQGGSEWSVHPPFSLVVLYGVQDTSIEVNALNKSYDRYDGDNALLADQNQRLVEGFDPNDPSRLILDGCELMSVSRGYDPGAHIIAEQYQFFARDIIVPSAKIERGRTNKRISIPSPPRPGERTDNFQ